MVDVERNSSFNFLQSLETPSIIAPPHQESLAAHLREIVGSVSAGADNCFDSCISPPAPDYDFGYYPVSGNGIAEHGTRMDMATALERILNNTAEDHAKVGNILDHSLVSRNGAAGESPDASEDMVMPVQGKRRDYGEDGEEYGDSGDSDVFVRDNSKRLRQCDIASNPSVNFEDGPFPKVDLSSLNDTNASIPKRLIEPKYARVDIETISAKEARRVLNNRKSAHKSYLRKKEKMQKMEERLAKYEKKFAEVSRQVSQVLSAYEKVAVENRQLKNRLRELQQPNSRNNSQSLW